MLKLLKNKPYDTSAKSSRTDVVLYRLNTMSRMIDIKTFDGLTEREIDDLKEFCYGVIKLGGFDSDLKIAKNLDSRISESERLSLSYFKLWKLTYKLWVSGFLVATGTKKIFKNCNVIAYVDRVDLKLNSKSLTFKDLLEKPTPVNNGL